MAQSWRVGVGAAVRYRTAGGRVQHAVVTAVTDQTTVDLRVGNGATKSVVAAAVRGLPHASGAGWYR